MKVFLVACNRHKLSSDFLLFTVKQQLKEEEKSGGEKKENQKIKDASDGKSDDDVNVEGAY